MTRYASNTTHQKLAERINASQQPVITTHTKPDGDAIGSTLALARGLGAKGKRPRLMLMGPLEPNLRTIIGSTPFSMVESSPPPAGPDLVIVVDTGSWNQVEPIAAWLKAHHSKVVVIDHHARGDAEVASQRLVEPRAVSTTMMLVPLLEAMHCELTGGIEGVAEALFVGLATDSGWFRYGNAGPEAFELAARLLECGVDKSRLYQILEETHGPQRLALEARALASVEYARRGSVAIQTLRPADFEAARASMEDLTGLVNTPMTVGNVRVSILLAQHRDGATKISFRSKPAPPGAAADDFADVNELAARFGGGGHVHAAGARLNMGIDQARQRVLELLAES